MLLPLLFFWIIVIVARDELGFQGFTACVSIWAALLVVCLLLGISPYVFIALQALLDALLIVFIFGGNIQIR